MASPVRNERLGFRVDPTTKDLIERAAALTQRKVSDFCLTALRETAGRTIAEHEALVLDDRDREAFFSALIDPPPLHPRLARALDQHARRVRT
jgi:uncharacterized protein (DUF1778 family)